MNPNQLLITNGTILDPVHPQLREAELLVVDGRVAKVGTGLKRLAPDAAVLDAAGGLVAPGFIDMHVHLREPGQEHKETIATGAAAAVAGGFTTICCMPNTSPAIDNDTQIEFVLTQAARAGLCNVLPMGAITKDREGKELSEMMLMHEAGAIGFTDDGVSVGEASVMHKALQYVKMFDGLISQHCEEPTLSGGSMNAGTTALRLGLGGIAGVSEELIIARDLLLNRRINARYHVQHISTAGAVELVRQAKKSGHHVTAEVTPHHLLLTDESCDGYDTNFKMNPPLRSRADVQACLEGIADGTIDALATDHAPHTREEKEVEFDKAPFGIVGLETALALYAEALVKPGLLNWQQLIEKMSAKPAAILRLKDRGNLLEGAIADIAIVDQNRHWKIEPDKFRSKGRNTPFAGRMVTGAVRYTLLAGKMVYQRPAEH
ncbi:MAG TPA: dihydroorotase [Phycisphaerae bacterium]|nr:dihydroorotase [Phycisphaerae bacterium]